MRKPKAYVVLFSVLALAGGITYKWGLNVLLQVILGVSLVVLALVLVFFLGLSIYIKSWGVAICLVLPLILIAYVAYPGISQEPRILSMIILILAGFFMYEILKLIRP
ncbi:hypothetical protein E3E31_03025 [Thermococcus sp. M39]|uniref:hypothetical protein n=1 Tax=unclassified Thermococcus TaxID=2627626 RepID=UPI00143CA96E|nr:MULTISPECIES: hypothetical protein [unclassified Thermococcus]NJE07505.1 hypothetical protein [Thermococcus sp. M39]NJE13829.1 hypothetical protein [Thermococcus sp. LS2]